MGVSWEKGQYQAWSLLCHWLSPVLTSSFPSPITPKVSLQSATFWGIDLSHRVMLTVFSGLSLGADCPPTLDILSALYCRVPETRLNLVSQSSVNSPQLYLIGQKCSQLDAPGVQPILLG